MFNTYFENSQEVERLIGSSETEDECFDIIKKFLDDHNFKSYYYNIHNTVKGKCVDAGSWSEFFYIREE